MRNNQIYRKCRKIKHTIYCCKVPVGSAVLNKLFDIETINKHKGKVFYTPRDVNYAKRRNKGLYEILKNNIVKDNDLVVYGVCGELRIESIENLSKEYITNKNEALNNEDVLNECFTFIRGKKVNTLKYMSTLKKEEYKLSALRKAYSNWIKLTYNSKSKEVFCVLPIPFERKVGIANVRGVKHGKGDFVVYRTRQNGEPIISTRRVVNGIEFKGMFNKRGISKYIDENSIVNKLNRPKSLV